MSTITIGTESRDLLDADPQWIINAILQRRRDGLDICVILDLEGDQLQMHLRTPKRANGAGGGRAPTPREREVLELWAKLGLNDSDFAPGNVVAFVQQVKRRRGNGARFTYLDSAINPDFTGRCAGVTLRSAGSGEAHFSRGPGSPARHDV